MAAERLTAIVGAGGAFEAPKLASVVARRLADEIVEHRWPVGEVIGSETELLERFGVSRAVLREAVRIIEHTGAARMRRGPGGGLVVSAPNRDAVVRAMGVWLSYVGVTLTEIIEARLPVLIAVCKLASQRIDRTGAVSLRASVDEIIVGDDLLARRINAIEAAIADVAGNPALSLVLASVADLGINRLRSGLSVLEPGLTTADAVAHLDGYRQLVDAVAKRDGDRAEAIVTQLTEFVLTRLREGPAPRARRASGGHDRKLAETVARALQEDIERRGWKVGDVLGSESELVEQYGVSRAILREAVRILEHYGAVRTKRGPGGGLIVTAPDATVLVSSARIVLEYDGVTGAQLLEARGVIDVVAARLAALRCTEADATRLRGALEAERRAGDAALSFMTLHDAIAATTGNRVLVLFVDLMADLVPAHLDPGHRSPEGLAALSAEVHVVHRRIVEAVIGGDAELAERRMARHVRASAVVLR